MFLECVMFTRIYMGLLDVQILWHQVFELPEPLPGDNRFCVIEIYDFFKQRQAPSEVEEVEVIRVVLLE